MIDQSTNRVLESELLSLIEAVPYYYIKSSSIENIISMRGRKFYSKYKLVNEKPNRIVLNQHLNRELSIAIPLLEKQIFIRYFGENSRRFLYILNRVLKRFDVNIGSILVYQSLKNDNIDILIIVKGEMEAQKVIDEVSLTLNDNLTKEWKILPKRDLPKSYNIFPLPYRVYPYKFNTSLKTIS